MHPPDIEWLFFHLMENCEGKNSHSMQFSDSKHQSQILLTYRESIKHDNKKFLQRQNRHINYLLIHSCTEQLQPNIPAFPSLTDGPHPRLKLSVEAKAALIYWQHIDLSRRMTSNTKSPTSTGVWSLWICCLCC